MKMVPNYSCEDTMHTYSRAMKLGVTCARWGGQRSAGQNVPAYFVDVIDDYAKGVCYGGGYRKMPILPTATCQRYEKWVALK